MGLRQQISQPPEVRAQVVEDNGDRYLFQGTPDANIMARTLLLTPDKVQQQALHWSRVLGSPVDPDLVKHVLIVHATLQPKEWDPTAQEFVDATAYDVTEVARFAQTNGPCFLKMIPAAFAVLGLTEEEVGSEATLLDKVVSGNSEESADTSSN